MQKESEILAPSLTPEILYEDREILALNKGAGLMVHGDGRSKEETLADWLLENYPNLKEVGEKIELQNGEKIIRPGIVHRLDRWTSGVMLVAKTSESHSNLKKQFQDREIKKTYHAFVYGKLKDNFGTINMPLGRSKGDFRQYTSPKNVRGEMREAVTYYEVINRFMADGENIDFLKVMPKTGRTHQIRAHFKAMGHPVLCDRVYAKERPCILGFNRTALHAREIVFKNLEGKEIKVEAPYPEDFKEALKFL